MQTPWGGDHAHSFMLANALRTTFAMFSLSRPRSCHYLISARQSRSSNAPELHCRVCSSAALRSRSPCGFGRRSWAGASASHGWCHPVRSQHLVRCQPEYRARMLRSGLRACQHLVETYCGFKFHGLPAPCVAGRNRCIGLGWTILESAQAALRFTVDRLQACCNAARGRGDFINWG